MSERPGTFRSLKVRNYRLYWSVQLVSMLGTWMRLVALSWLVLTTLHGGGADVGLVAAAQFTPTLLLGAWAGVISDRRSPLAILKVTQVLMAMVDATLFALVVTGSIRLWMVFPLAALVGLVGAFDNPCRQAMVTELVGPDLASNAVALNSMGFNSARVVGPAIAGGLIQVAGTQLCFAVDAVSYFVALAGLIAIHRDALFPRPRVTRAKGQVREGLHYALHVPVLRATLLTMAVVGTLSMNFTVLVPLLARSFTSSAATFGLLSAAMGVGSLVGSVVVARRSAPTVRHLAVASGSLAVTMCLVAASPGFALAAVALAATGTCVMTFLATVNSLLQLNSTPEMRGRVVALYVVLLVGTSPLGAPIVGWIAQTHGVRTSLLFGAVGAIVGTAIARTPAPVSLAQPAVEAPLV